MWTPASQNLDTPQEGFFYYSIYADASPTPSAPSSATSLASLLLRGDEQSHSAELSSKRWISAKALWRMPCRYTNLSTRPRHQPMSPFGRPEAIRAAHPNPRPRGSRPRKDSSARGSKAGSGRARRHEEPASGRGIMKREKLW